MIKCKLKKGVGFHIRKEPGKGTVRYQPGDIMKVKNISELGGAADKFEILDKIPEEKELQLDAPPVGLKMEHRGGGRYNVVNVETGEAVNEEHLTKKEAQAMLDAIEPERELDVPIPPEPADIGKRKRKNA